MKRVVIVGSGNAGMCAAIAARENGAHVTVVERGPETARGGNSAFTAGAMRVAYSGVEDIKALFDSVATSQLEKTDFGSYTETQFMDDMARVTEYRCDPELTEVLVKRSLETLYWLKGHGVSFAPIYGRQAFKVDGRFAFWGGLVIEAAGGGPGLVDAEIGAAINSGVEIWYDSRATDLLSNHHSIRGVRVDTPAGTMDLEADAVVLASGGFEANPEWRTKYLGPGWDLAKVRGTRFNTGDGIRMALGVGASTAGNWSGCHAVAWDRNAPEFGDIAVGDGFQKHSYPFGIVVNSDGERFVDEGLDFRNYTYAKYGRAILAQPGQVAWQIFDSKVAHLLRDEYGIRQVSVQRADTLAKLADKLDGLDAPAFLETVENFNSAVMQDVPFNPNIRDGRGTNGLQIRKSNWANVLEHPPFEAYQVTCGITFTFGGLRVDADSRVLDESGFPIGGLYGCGELIGGLFYFNYPGGAGLTSGSVFGRLAGIGAASA